MSVKFMRSPQVVSRLLLMFTTAFILAGEISVISSAWNSSLVIGRAADSHGVENKDSTQLRAVSPSPPGRRPLLPARWLWEKARQVADTLPQAATLSVSPFESARTVPLNMSDLPHS